MLEALESRVLLSRTWFVSPSGNDAYPGTISQPFHTIQRAASLAQPGDTVFLRAGTYRETVTPAHSGTASAPITYSAYGDEIVTIDGADLLTGWTKNANSSTIYSAPQSWNLGAGNNQVFVDGVAMSEAAWPNTAVGAIQPATASVSAVSSSVIGNAYYSADTATISVSGLPGGIGAWNGATIHFGAGQSWVIQTGTVLSSGNGTLTFAYQHQTAYETPVAGNKFYLTGKLLGLDHAGEWYYDQTTGRLNLWTTNSTSPASHTVEVKRRQFAFELSGLSYINIRNVRLFAASIDTSATSHNLMIDSISASYVSQQTLNPIGWIMGPSTGIIIQGYSNILENSDINWSSGNGVYLGGSNNIVQYCSITNTDLSGVDAAAITLVGTNNQVLHNLIKDTGRDGILDSNATHASIEYNTISNIGHQTTDLGAVYDYGTDSHGTVIAYNTISNIHTGGFGGDGVYLDNGSADYSVHNNTISNVQIPIKDNPPSYSNSIYNNVINGKNVANSSSAGGSPAASPKTFNGSSSTLTTLGTTGGFRSNGFAINDIGEVVGASISAAGSPAFLYVNGKMQAVNAFGANNGSANAINNAGQFVGQALDSAGRNIAFLDSSGKITSLGTLPGDFESSANAINSSAQIAGISFGSDGIGNAFLYSNGAMNSLGTLGGSSSQAYGISDSGVVVGSSTIAGNRDAHAFSWSAGKMTDLGTLGGSSSYAYAINKTGQIAGASKIKGNSAFHAFLYTAGKMKDLGTLSGYTNSVATGIDSAGDVVGYCYNSDVSMSHAFLYRNGVMIDLNKVIPAGTGWIVTQATSINDKNQITGTVSDSTGKGRAYLLTILK